MFSKNGIPSENRSFEYNNNYSYKDKKQMALSLKKAIQNVKSCLLKEICGKI